MEIDYGIAVALVFIVIGIAYPGHDRARERRAMAAAFNAALDHDALFRRARAQPFSPFPLDWGDGPMNFAGVASGSFSGRRRSRIPA